jgi:hypothetical protein
MPDRACGSQRLYASGEQRGKPVFVGGFRERGVVAAGNSARWILNSHSGELKYAGKVGMRYSRKFRGLSGQVAADQASEADNCPSEGTFGRARVHWVKSRYLAQVGFIEGCGATFFSI